MTLRITWGLDKIMYQNVISSQCLKFMIFSFPVWLAIIELLRRFYMLINPGSNKVTNSREYISQRICEVESCEFSNELFVRLLK